MSRKVKLFENDSLITVNKLPDEVINGGTYVIEQQNPNNYTHSYFKYPCKFIPEIPRWFINRELKDSKGNVLDPFSGSGTTLVEAIIHGHQAYGTEIDELAKLLISVKTTPLTYKEIEYINNWISDFKFKNKDSKKYGVFYNINNLNHWFTKENSYKLSYILNEIKDLDNANIKNFLKICFASILRKSSNADDVSPKPYVSSRIKKVPADPFEIFPNTVEKYLKYMEGFSKLFNNKRPVAEILKGDALDIKTNKTFDIAITSPPYINAFDYARILRLENLWLDLETEDSLRNKKPDYVGTENIRIKNEVEDLSILNESELLKNVYYKIEKIDKKRALIVKKFFEDMKLNLKVVHDKLKLNGSYCIVIGNSTIRKVNIESWKILIDIAKGIGYELETYYSYIIQNHYLRIPRSGRGGKVNKDYVVVLKKNEQKDE